MSLIIGKDKTKTIELHEPVAGIRILVKYRRPTADEQIAFQADSLHRKGDRIINDRFGAGLKHMRYAILEFSFPNSDEALCIEGKKGQMHPLSNIETDPGFHKEWYRLLLEYVPGIMIELGANIFGLVLRNYPAQKGEAAGTPAKPPQKKTAGKKAKPGAADKNAEETAPN